MNEELPAAGQMRNPVFINITQKDGVSLADLKIAGYEDNEGCWGDVWIAMLKSNGANQKIGNMNVTYYWFDEEGEYEPGWYDNDENPLKNDESVLGNAEDIYFDVGAGLWLGANTDWQGCYFVTAGEVFKQQLNYPIEAAGQIAGNPNPVSIKLSDISISGYEENEGCWGDVWIAMLKSNGANQKAGNMNVTYYWFDEEGEYEAGWYDNDESPLKDDESALGNADEIEFAAGESLWVGANSDWQGCSTINFPALKLND